MSHNIPSEGARWVITELMYLSGQQLAAEGTALGGLLGLSPDSGHQWGGAVTQGVANVLDGAVDLLAEGVNVAKLSRGKLIPMMAKAGMGAFQMNSSESTVFLAACGALAIDAGLAIVCPPVGIGLVFCAISLTFDAVAIGAAAGGLHLGSEAGAALARQAIFRQRCMVALPHKQFHNWKFDARDPGQWFPF